MTRKLDEIKQITVHCKVGDYDGWVVDIEYMDGKYASGIVIDRGTDPRFDMLNELARVIKLQLESKQK